jgi:hypothetical protein
VVSAAGTHEKVAAVVYIAAFAPDKGESVSTLIADPPPGAPVPPILPPRNGFLFLDRDKFHESFAADLPAETAAFMADSQVPWGVDALGGAVSEPAWRVRPSWYLVASDDRMIPPPAQRAMAERAGATVSRRRQAATRSTCRTPRRSRPSSVRPPLAADGATKEHFASPLRQAGRATLPASRSGTARGRPRGSHTQPSQDHIWALEIRRQDRSSSAGTSSCLVPDVVSAVGVPDPDGRNEAGATAPTVVSRLHGHRARRGPSAAAP